jgi:hypothetical protein
MRPYQFRLPWRGARRFRIDELRDLERLAVDLVKAARFDEVLRAEQEVVELPMFSSGTMIWSKPESTLAEVPGAARCSAGARARPLALRAHALDRFADRAVRRAPADDEQLARLVGLIDLDARGCSAMPVDLRRGWSSSSARGSRPSYEMCRVRAPSRGRRCGARGRACPGSPTRARGSRVRTNGWKFSPIRRYVTGTA